MAFYRRVVEVSPKQRTQHRRADGGRYAEELREGLTADSSLLYHRGRPRRWSTCGSGAAGPDDDAALAGECARGG